MNSIGTGSWIESTTRALQQANSEGVNGSQLRTLVTQKAEDLFSVPQLSQMEVSNAVATACRNAKLSAEDTLNAIGAVEGLKADDLTANLATGLTQVAGLERAKRAREACKNLKDHNPVIKDLVRQLGERVREFRAAPENKRSHIFGQLHTYAGHIDGVSIVMSHNDNMFLQSGLADETFHICGNEGQTDDVGQGKSVELSVFDSDQSLNLMIKEARSDESLSSVGLLGEAIQTRAVQGYEEMLKHLIEHPEKIPSTLMIHNLMSLDVSIPAAVVARNFVRDFQKDFGIEVIGMHHDFYQTRPLVKHTEAFKLFNEFCNVQTLSDYGDWKHVVINHRDQKKLQNLGLDGTIVFNPEDFCQIPPIDRSAVNAFNGFLKERFDVDAEKGIRVTQNTRCVPRKAIEVAVGLVDGMRKFDSGLNFINMGYGNPTFDQDRHGYRKFLGDDMERRGLTHNAFVGEHIDIHKDDIDRQEFSIATLVRSSDIVTYFSNEEGFGNNLLEFIRFAVTPQLMQDVAGMLGMSSPQDLSDPKDVWKLTQDLFAVVGKVDEDDPHLGIGKQAYDDMAAWVEKNPDLVPPAAVVGGDGLGYEVMQEIKAKTDAKFVFVPGDAVEFKESGLHDTFNEVDFPQDTYPKLIADLATTTRGKVQKVLWALHNLHNFNKAYGYEAIGEIYSQEVDVQGPSDQS